MRRETWLKCRSRPVGGADSDPAVVMTTGNEEVATFDAENNSGCGKGAEAGDRWPLSYRCREREGGTIVRPIGRDAATHVILQTNRRQSLL